MFPRNAWGSEKFDSERLKYWSLKWKQIYHFFKQINTESRIAIRQCIQLLPTQKKLLKDIYIKFHF